MILALELFHELNEARERRRTIAALRLPEGLRWFVFIGGAVTVGALWLVFIESEALQAIFTVGMTWVVVAISSIMMAACRSLISSHLTSVLATRS